MSRNSRDTDTAGLTSLIHGNLGPEFTPWGRPRNPLNPHTLLSHIEGTDAFTGGPHTSYKALACPATLY